MNSSACLLDVPIGSPGSKSSSWQSSLVQSIVRLSSYATQCDCLPFPFGTDTVSRVSSSTASSQSALLWTLSLLAQETASRTVLPDSFGWTRRRHRLTGSPGQVSASHLRKDGNNTQHCRMLVLKTRSCLGVWQTVTVFCKHQEPVCGVNLRVHRQLGDNPRFPCVCEPPLSPPLQPFMSQPALLWQPLGYFSTRHCFIHPSQHSYSGRLCSVCGCMNDQGFVVWQSELPNICLVPVSCANGS